MIGPNHEGITRQDPCPGEQRECWSRSKMYPVSAGNHLARVHAATLDLSGL